jgi:shikimate kinase
MALEKVITQDKIEIVGEFKAVQVRTKTAIIDDGLEISSAYSRKVISAGDDYLGESAEVQAICSVVHTEAVVAAYATYLDEMQDY